jgi:hypothetical protein
MSDLPVGQINCRAQKPVQPPREKYFAFSEAKISRNVCAVPPRSEGRTRRHGRWVRDAMDALATQDERRHGGRRNRVVLTPRRWRQGRGVYSANDGGKRARSPGRSRISRKTIAQGRPDDPPVPVVLPRAFCCTRTMGAVGTRPSLRPLISEGGSRNNSGAIRAARRRRCI